MLSVKRLLICAMVGVMIANITPNICYASDTSRAGIGNEVEPAMLLETIHIPAAECREIYNNMQGYNGWIGSIASIVAGLIPGAGTLVGGITGIATLIQQMNYNMVKKTFKEGADSGRGCTMYIWDNAAPTIMAN